MMAWNMKCFVGSQKARLRVGVLAASLMAPVSAWSETAVESGLGGSMTQCRGAIAWGPEADGEAVRVEALHLAALAGAEADRVALYAAEKDFTHEDVLVCTDGICSAHRVTGTGATTSVLRLSRGLDYGSGRVQYDLDAAFTIVSTRGGPMLLESVIGRGGFICDAELSTAIAPATE